MARKDPNSFWKAWFLEFGHSYQDRFDNCAHKKNRMGNKPILYTKLFQACSECKLIPYLVPIMCLTIRIFRRDVLESIEAITINGQTFLNLFPKQCVHHLMHENFLILIESCPC